MINRIARNHKMSKQEASKVVNTMFEGIQTNLKRGRTCNFAGFGSFMVKKTSGYTARNPRTGTTRKIAPSKQVVFNPASSWNPAKSRKKSSTSKQKRSYRRSY
jgi:DNA-binding protein HU-beta